MFFAACRFLVPVEKDSEPIFGSEKPENGLPIAEVIEIGGQTVRSLEHAIRSKYSDIRAVRLLKNNTHSAVVTRSQMCLSKLVY